LSVESAMKLPRNLKLADSISSAVANADYIRLVNEPVVVYRFKLIDSICSPNCFQERESRQY
jgi:hypothetical protein